MVHRKAQIAARLRYLSWYSLAMTPPRALPDANFNFFINFTFDMHVIFNSTVISKALHYLIFGLVNIDGLPDGLT